MVALLLIGWRYLHRVSLPTSYPWVLGYAVAIVALSEVLYRGSKGLGAEVGVHLEVLLPAFVLGCVLAIPRGCDLHADDTIEGHLEGPPDPTEQRAATIISACFMFLVGMSMPAFVGPAAQHAASGGWLVYLSPPLGWGMILLHVGAITAVSNLGKMFIVFCYSQEASFRERLALSIGMWPRGEVGAGILVLSLGYEIGGPIMIVAILSLALNLLLTGVFIVIIKALIAPPRPRPVPAAAREPRWSTRWRHALTRLRRRRVSPAHQ